MNKPRILAAEVARMHLHYAWDATAVERAFREKWRHTLGNAMRLVNPLYYDDLVLLQDVFDAAQMTKKDMNACLWLAARCVYEEGRGKRCWPGASLALNEAVLENAADAN